VQDSQVLNESVRGKQTVTAAGAVRALGVRLARSVACGSFPRLPHQHFASPGLAAQTLIRAGKTSVTCNVMCHLHKMIC